MVLAEFLNTNLLEPHKRRLRAKEFDKGRAEGHTEGHSVGRAEGHIEGRAETLAEVRLALQKAGINLDDYLPPAQEAEVPSASRC